MRAYALVASGSITLASIKAAKASNRKKCQGPKLPAIIAPITQKEIEQKTNRLSTFSGKGWAGPTKSMIGLCNSKVSDATMKDIIREAKEVSRASRRLAKEEENSDFDNDDLILDLPNGSDGSSDGDTPCDYHMKDADELKEDSNDDSDHGGDSHNGTEASDVDDEANYDVEDDDGDTYKAGGNARRSGDIDEEDDS